LANFEALNNLYQEVRYTLESQLKRAQGGVEDYYDEVATLTSNAQSSLNSFMTFYDGVFDSLATLSVDTDDGLPWLSMTASDFIPDDPNWPSTTGILTDVDSIPGAAYIYGATADSLGEVKV
jgi:hypothetical protein